MIVIWDKKDYLLECEKQLSDRNVYEPIDKLPLDEVNKCVKACLSEMLVKKEITKKIYDFLLIKKSQLGRFYLLPKIHKRMSNVLGRPVISNNGTITENVSCIFGFSFENNSTNNSIYLGRHARFFMSVERVTRTS